MLNQKYKQESLFIIPEDTYIAKLYSAVDIGEHEAIFSGETKKVHQVVLTFELQDADLPDGRPSVISHTYTASLNDKARLKPVIHALLGGTSEAMNLIESEDEDLTSLLSKSLGKPVQLSVVHREKDKKKYVNIGVVMALPKSMQKSVTPLFNEKIIISDVENIINPDSIPEWLIKRINNRLGNGVKYLSTKSKEESNSQDQPF